MLGCFTEKVNNKEAIIAIVGVGYVGLPLLLRFTEVGYRVIGIDIDDAKNCQLNAGKSFIKHITHERVSRAKPLFIATSDFSKAAEAHAIILCVPTPLNKYREPDLTFVLNTMEALQPYLTKGQMISLESTTYPGTTEEELKPRIESQGLVVGQDIFLVYSPEREDPGNIQFSTADIPKICGGDTENCRIAGQTLYSAIINTVIPVSNTKVAEMTKLLENIHRSVNIGLVNEMKILADKMHIDIHEVIEAAATKPFGFIAYNPGPGIGGHCIPIDPFYLTWKAREYGIHTRFIELAGEINSYMPHWVVNKVMRALNEHEKTMKNSRILMLGIAYKKDIDDVRESPAIAMMALLQERGAVVDYSDPHVPVFPKMRAHAFDLSSITLTAEALNRYDCVILATAHSAFDYALIAQCARLVIDTRGALRAFKTANIVMA
jgi:UDP-N-acetyl-D-glucosamine dehydrogenase